MSNADSKRRLPTSGPPLSARSACACGGGRSNALVVINSVWTDDGQILLQMSLPGMAYGAVAAWQSAPVDRQLYFSDYARIVYPADISVDVAAAVEELSQSETELQKVLGEPTQVALWEDPFFSTYLKNLAQNREHLRQTRLLDEEAESHLYRVLAFPSSTPNLKSLLVGARLLDYAGQKFQTPPELIELWEKSARRGPKTISGGTNGNRRSFTSTIPVSWT